MRARIEIEATLEAVAGRGHAETFAPMSRTTRSASAGAGHRSPGRCRLGILHGAGAIADRRLEEKTAADFDRVYAPSVRGLRDLLAALDEDDLRFIVLFSSAAAFYGNAGQADYAVANEVLNKAAYRLRSRLPACRVIAFDWGPWAGGEGMVTPSLERLFEERGIDLVPPAAGAAIVADALEPGAESAGAAPRGIALHAACPVRRFAARASDRQAPAPGVEPFPRRSHDRRPPGSAGHLRDGVDRGQLRGPLPRPPGRAVERLSRPRRRRHRRGRDARPHP